MGQTERRLRAVRLCRVRGAAPVIPSVRARDVAGCHALPVPVVPFCVDGVLVALLMRVGCAVAVSGFEVFPLAARLPDFDFAATQTAVVRLARFAWLRKVGA